MRLLFIGILSLVLVSTGCMDTESEYTPANRDDGGNLNIDLATIENSNFYKDSFNGSGGYIKSSEGGKIFLDEDKVTNQSLRTFMINYRDKDNAGKFTEGPPNVIISGYANLSETINLEKHVEKHAQGLRNDSLRELDSVNEKDGRFIVKSREIAGNRTARYAFKAIGQENNLVYSMTLVDFEEYKEDAGLELTEALKSKLGN